MSSQIEMTPASVFPKNGFKFGEIPKNGFVFGKNPKNAKMGILKMFMKRCYTRSYPNNFKKVFPKNFPKNGFLKNLYVIG